MVYQYISSEQTEAQGEKDISNHSEFDSMMAYKGLSNKQFSTGVKTATGQDYYLTP